MVAPLEGVKLLDLTQVLMGPSATQLLGDYGAEVIKVEQPGVGDVSRRSRPDPAGPINPVFMSLNRNKRSIAINLRHPAGRQVMLDLVARSDGIVSNYRPGVMERLGLGYQALRDINPGLIYAVGSGFGQSGPYVHKPGQDFLAQAYTGVLERRADPDVPLTVPASALADYITGLHLVQGILLALLARQKTGRGQIVEVSLYSSMLAAQMSEATMELMRGQELNWGSTPVTGVYPTQDGAIVIVGGLSYDSDTLDRVCAALGVEGIADQEALRTPEGYASQRGALKRLLDERLQQYSTAQALALLEAQDIFCAPVKPLREALRDDQTRENGMLLEFEHPAAGVVQTVGSPIRLSETPMQLRYVPPQLSAHAHEILEELGYDPDRIRELRNQGAIG